MAGRKSIYDTMIAPRLDEIKKWSSLGVTDKRIAEMLGISEPTFFKYKKEKEELRDIVLLGRSYAVEQIENAMYQSALGGKQTLKKSMKVKRVLYQKGKKDKEVEIMEPYEEEIYISPNVTAAIYLLKHWAKEKGYTNDPLTLEFKREELAYKKELEGLGQENEEDDPFNVDL